MSDVVAGLALSQAAYCSLPQKKQLPQEMVKGTTTRWPFASVLFGPVSTTSPMNSWPRMSPARMVGI